MRSQIMTIISILLLVACNQPTPIIDPPTSSGKSLGLVEVTFTGVGTNDFKSTARSISSNGQTRALTDLANGIEMLPVAKTSFEIGTRGTDGMRYLSATYKVRNAAFCSPQPCSGTAYNLSRQNLTFMAISTTAPLSATLNQTAVSSLKLFNGSNANASIAPSILPTHGMNFNGVGAVLNSGLEDFQAFTETTASSLTNLPAGVSSVFPYGFVTRCVSHCTPGTRDLAANPSANQFDGRVTFAVKLPLQATPSADPFSFSLMFEVVDDSITRVTQSLEEQSTPSLVAARGAALTGAEVFKLPSLTNINPSTCSVRTAGTVVSPTAFLVKTSLLTAKPVLANNMSAAKNSVITASFLNPFFPGNSSTFTVNGSMTGQIQGAYGIAGNDLHFAPTNANKPGEQIEVSLTNGLACSPYTFRFSTAVEVASPGTFGTAAAFHGVGNTPVSIASGDLNNDGKIDVITANFTSNNVSVMLGNGDGTFNPIVNYNVGTNPVSVVIGDLNNDRKLDLVIANSASANISLLFGVGDGTFNPALNYSTVYNNTLLNPHSITMGDLNSDGNLDLAIVSYNYDFTTVLLGNNDGVFTSRKDYFVGHEGVSITINDLNSDGKLDLIIANKNSSSASILLGVGNGVFGNSIEQPVTNIPQAITTGDLNNDGKLDLITINSTYNTVSVSLGLDSGAFFNIIDYTVAQAPNSIVTGDLNGDGKLDLITTNSNSDNVSVLLGNNSKTLDPPVDYTVGINPSSVTTADLNGDGKLDLITANAGTNDIAVLLQP